MARFTLLKAISIDTRATVRQRWSLKRARPHPLVVDDPPGAIALIELSDWRVGMAERRGMRRVGVALISLAVGFLAMSSAAFSVPSAGFSLAPPIGVPKPASRAGELEAKQDLLALVDARRRRTRAGLDALQTLVDLMPPTVRLMRIDASDKLVLAGRARTTSALDRLVGELRNAGLSVGFRDRSRLARGEDFVVVIVW